MAELGLSERHEQTAIEVVLDWENRRTLKRYDDRGKWQWVLRELRRRFPNDPAITFLPQHCHKELEQWFEWKIRPSKSFRDCAFYRKPPTDLEPKQPHLRDPLTNLHEWGMHKWADRAERPGLEDTNHGGGAPFEWRKPCGGPLWQDGPHAWSEGTAVLSRADTMNTEQREEAHGGPIGKNLGLNRYLLAWP
mmetsp:Transcript_4565/g.9957  ORF Transcript_4565/g.9957 Transcript_4565/m.9957 type:complete len:192 (-) Transcript_4565:74-649(-)